MKLSKERKELNEEIKLRVEETEKGYSLDDGAYASCLLLKAYALDKKIIKIKRCSR